MEESRSSDLRQRTDETLREQLELLDFAHILIRDMDNRITFWNKGAQKLYGWPKREAIGRIALALLETQFPESRAAYEAELFAQGHWEGQLIHTRRDGTQLVVASHQVLHRDRHGAPLEILEINDDITERVRAESERAAALETLRQTQELLTSLLEYAPMPIYVASNDGHMRLVNRAWEEFDRVKREDAVGRHLEELYPAEVARQYLEMNRRVADTAAPLVTEETGDAPDGQHYFHTVKFPLYGATGQVEAVGGISIDITKRKQAEAEVQKLNEDLERRVAERTSQLKAANQELKSEIARRAWAELQREATLEALQASKELQERTFAGLREAIFIVDAATAQIIECNPAASETFGYTRAEMLGQTTAFLHADETALEEFRRQMYSAIEKRGFLFLPEFRMKRKDGTLFPTEHSVLPLEDEHGRRVAWVSVVRDITERKQAEKALRDSEARFSTIFHSSPMPIALTRLGDGKLVDVNQAWLDLTGYTYAEVIGASPLDVNLYVNSDRRSQLVNELRAQGRVDRYEFQLRKKSGEVADLLFSAELVELQDESLMLSMALDITERKQAEQALRDSEEKFRTFIEASLEAIMLIDEQGTLIEWNRAYEEVTGLKRNEAIGQHAWDMQFRLALPERRTPELYERLKSAGLEALRTGQAPFFQHVLEAEFCRPSGERRYMEQVLFPIKTVRGYRIGVISRDVSGRKQAEAALQESEARFRVIFENAPLGIALVDMTGRPTRTNTALRKMLGYSEPELAHMTFTNFTHPDDAQADWSLFTELVAGKRDQYQIEKRYIRRDGQVMWGQLSTSLIRNPDGATQYVIGMVEDITKRRQADEERERLLEQVHSLAGYLQAAQEEERARIAREIHDEFGQALTALKMDLAWLTRQLPGNKPRLANKLKAMAGLLDATIGTVRHVAAELRPGLLDDLGLVEALQWLAQGFAERTGIECSLHLGEEEVTLGRDLDTAIFRIAQESLTNVARHAGATKVRLEMEARPDGWLLTIQDNGRGITDSQLADPNSLGLMGMRERARAWGGDIVIQGIPGQGTIVSVVIPNQTPGKDAP
jgi:two-component system sensor histidine kinase UhpB